MAVMVLLALGAAPARAEWSEPERVSPPSIVSDPFLGYTRDGRPVVAWHVRQPYGTHNPGSVAESGLAVRAADGWRHTRIHPALDLALVDGPSERFFVAGVRYAWNGYDLDEPAHFDAFDVAWDRAGAPVAPQGRDRGLPRGTGVVAEANDRGDRAAAWFGMRGRVYASTAPAGRRMGRPQRIGSDLSRDFQRVAADVNARGDAAVAWRSGSRVLVRVARRGKRFGAARVAGSAAGEGRVLGVALGAAGAIDVVWARKAGPQAAIVTSHADDGRRFDRPRVVDLDFRGTFDARSATGRDGELFLAWINRDGADPVVRVAAIRDGTVSIQELRRAPEPWPRTIRVAADRRGHAAVAWPPRYPEREVRVFAAGPGEPFAPMPPVPVVTEVAGAVSVAIEPATGRPGLAFTTSYATSDDTALFYTVLR